MPETVNFFGTTTRRFAGSTVEFFDPPMCCPTGLCGPALDQTLLDVNEMIMALKAEGAKVERYQMTSHPHLFLNNAEIMRLVRERQMEALPLTLVQGQVIKVGAYPSLAEITAALNGSLNHKTGDLS
jgi:hypothetical protein